MYENNVKVWLARDKFNSLNIYGDFGYKPQKETFPPDWDGDCNLDVFFPQIKWEDDEPTEAYITLAEPQEQQKKEIDWEQRRFEIAKDILATMFFQPENHSLTVEADVDFAVEVADILIEKLKGGKR